MLKQRLQQKLLQRLSPQQIQLMKLIQLPAIALEQRIKEEMEENPALEEGPEEDDFLNESEKTDDDSDFDQDDEVSEITVKDNNFDIGDYIDEDDIPSYKLNANNFSADDTRKEMPMSSGTSFQEYLISQLGLHIFDNHHYNIGLHIIGNLDESGYLQRDAEAMVNDLAFSQNIMVTADEILSVLKIIQEFDPPGVGARDLRECLLLQLQRKDATNPLIAKAIIIITECFDEFTKKHYPKILKKLDIPESELKEIINEIIKLNPKPGDSMSETSKINQYIIPDFIINIINDEPELTLNSKNSPDLRISRTYYDMMQSYSNGNNKNKKVKEALVFLKQKVDSAKWFIDSIRQRQDTLYFTMKAIMDYQREYFLEGDETKLRPMILKNIADIVGLDISTVSRVANQKYVQTPYGTFLLKTFFSESLETDSGEEVSTREVKKILTNCIEAEDKKIPLSDEKLQEILNGKGYNIARRTIAKYREQLSIPVARLRKEI